MSQSLFNKSFLPCWFYNTGGCYDDYGNPKNQEHCKYLHIKLDHPMEKPQHLKIPCRYYHLYKKCLNACCTYGHCELSEQKWEKYFPTNKYPGQFYAMNYHWDGNLPPSPPPQVQQNSELLEMIKKLLLK